MEENQMIPGLEAAFSSNTFSEEELAAFQLQLWQLLVRKSRLYTMGDSSSIREETAQELFSSICFLLSFYLKEKKMSAGTLIAQNPEDVLDEAVKICRQKTEAAKQLYDALCVSLSNIPNDFLTDTLHEIGLFFAHYDCRYFAHQIPCSIDYFLNQPVSEQVFGIEYISEYLWKLAVENDFLCRFSAEQITHLLSVAYPDFRGLPLNLFEPVFSNAVGRILLKKDLEDLYLNQKEVESLLILFGSLSKEKTACLLHDAGGLVAKMLGVQHPGVIGYFKKAAEALCPYIQRGVQLKTINGVFFTWART